MSKAERTRPKAPLGRLARLWNRLEAYSSRDRDERFEATHTLGLEPSFPSGTGWQIRHPQYDPKIEYIVRAEGLVKTTLFPKETVDHEVYSFIIVNGNTMVTPRRYTDTYGDKRVVLSIYTGDPIASATYPDLDPSLRKIGEGLIRNESTGDEVDSRVVVFQNQEKETVIYFQIEQVKRKGITITAMVPVYTA